MSCADPRPPLQLAHIALYRAIYHCERHMMIDIYQQEAAALLRRAEQPALAERVAAAEFPQLAELLAEVEAAGRAPAAQREAA